jgi:hypothetical protein
MAMSELADNLDSDPSLALDYACQVGACFACSLQIGQMLQWDAQVLGVV